MATKSNDDILAEFYCICGRICMGKHDRNPLAKEEITASCRAMLDSGQGDIVRDEFKNMGKSFSAGNK